MAKKAKAPEVQTEETTPVKVGQGVVVGTDLLNIRKGPSVNDRVLYVIYKDTTVEIISEPNTVKLSKLVTPNWDRKEHAVLISVRTSSSKQVSSSEIPIFFLIVLRMLSVIWILLKCA